jgi:predicted transcriptional regulator
MTLISWFSLINVMTMRHRCRDRIDIICHILEAANANDTKKTKMMYKANLSYPQVEEYLRVLTESDLLRYDSDRQTFKTTEKGLRFLDTRNQIDQMTKVQQV